MVRHIWRRNPPGSVCNGFALIFTIFGGWYESETAAAAAAVPSSSFCCWFLCVKSKHNQAFVIFFVCIISVLCIAVGFKQLEFISNRYSDDYKFKSIQWKQISMGWEMRLKLNGSFSRYEFINLHNSRLIWMQYDTEAFASFFGKKHFFFLFFFFDWWLNPAMVIDWLNYFLIMRAVIYWQWRRQQQQMKRLLNF